MLVAVELLVRWIEREIKEREGEERGRGGAFKYPWPASINQLLVLRNLSCDNNKESIVLFKDHI